MGFAATAYAGTTGVSQENGHLGFVPAFINRATGIIYLSRFANGSLCPCHHLDGLPEAVVLNRDEHGHVVAVLPTIEAGFYRAGRYYTRDEARQFGEVASSLRGV